MAKNWQTIGTVTPSTYGGYLIEVGDIELDVTSMEIVAPAVTAASSLANARLAAAELAHHAGFTQTRLQSEGMSYKIRACA